MNSPGAQSDSKHGKRRRKKGALAKEPAVAQGNEKAEEQAVASDGVEPHGDEDAAVGEPATTPPSADALVAARIDDGEHVAEARRADRNPRGGGRPDFQQGFQAAISPIRIAAGVPGGMAGRRTGSGGSGGSWGWMRWGLLLPVVGFTAWVVVGTVTHGWNGQWRSEETLFRIDTGQASGTGVGHAGGGATKSAAAGVGAQDTQDKEPPWKNPAKWTDSFGDGTPDFLRLTDGADQEAFRQWFVTIADYQAMRPAAQVPKEITDCASLLRYAYREALKKHDAGWVKDTGMEVGALPGEIGAWHYPDTPLGTGLFRITPGPFVQGDESDGAFAQFADAKTLVERNAYLVSRNVWQAEPGDLLFYRQFDQSSPWHSMIVTKVGSGAAVVYDTGEDHGVAGELRRVELTELLAHPQPEWRPLSSNPNFMGVYRWNILRGSL